MKILITGANGFIGRNLAIFLLGIKPAIKIYGLDIQKPLNFDKRIIFSKCDLLDTTNLRASLKKIKPDIIFHLAAQVSVPKSWANPQQTFEINVIGTLNLLEAIKDCCSKTIILIPGSSEEYKPRIGIKNQKMKVNEDALLLPQSPYGLSKMCQENLGYQYYKEYGLKTILVRNFNITGPGQSDMAVCSHFAKEVVEIEIGKKKAIIEVGNLNVVRDFVDVRDIVRAYYLAVQKCKVGQIYNIATGNGRKIDEILKKLLVLSEKKIKILKNHNAFRKFENQILIGDPAKFSKATGWKPRIDFFEQTIPDILNYWREKIKYK